MDETDTRLDNPPVDGNWYVQRNNGHLVVPTGIAGWNTRMISGHTTQMGTGHQSLRTLTELTKTRRRGNSPSVTEFNHRTQTTTSVPFDRGLWCVRLSEIRRSLSSLVLV